MNKTIAFGLLPKLYLDETRFVNASQHQPSHQSFAPFIIQGYDLFLKIIVSYIPFTTTTINTTLVIGKLDVYFIIFKQNNVMVGAEFYALV